MAVGRDHARHRPGDGFDGLTAFEHRIMELRARGMTRSEIALVVGRSPQTISNALTVAKDKLGARSLMEAAWLLSNPNQDEVTLLHKRHHFPS